MAGWLVLNVWINVMGKSLIGGHKLKIHPGCPGAPQNLRFKLIVPYVHCCPVPKMRISFLVIVFWMLAYDDCVT